MNGSRVRVGEGRFITFVFFFIDKKGDSIENNKINQKRQLRKKWFDNDNATLQLALYELIATNDERERLQTNYNKTDVTSQGESINIISLGSGTKPE